MCFARVYIMTTLCANTLLGEKRHSVSTIYLISIVDLKSKTKPVESETGSSKNKSSTAPFVLQPFHDSELNPNISIALTYTRALCHGIPLHGIVISKREFVAAMRLRVTLEPELAHESA